MENITVQEAIALLEQGFISDEEYNCFMTMKAKIIKDITKETVANLNNFDDVIPEDVDYSNTSIKMR